MRKFRIFDNNGTTIDRFTLINAWGDVYGFDEMPSNPFGFGQYCGNINQWKSKSTKHLGEKISFDALTEEAKTFVKERI